MTFQHKDMGGFRQLESSELERVSGGGSYDFQALDANSDGVITGAEMAAAHDDWTDDDFSDADTNGDGFLSAVELARLIVVSATPAATPWWYGLTSGLGDGYSGYSGGAAGDNSEPWYGGEGESGGYDPDADYCGSGWSSGIVPDTVMGVDISYACFTHDKNYDNYTDMTRLEADTLFAQQIHALLTLAGINSKVAATIAAGYFAGVRAGGGDYYGGPGAWNF